ncbi:MAG TPA: acyl carrier protein [bacterium]|uniref:Acyl carrier protein n=1 Tax=candidate division TA06 bacterium ADurb.Bin417 TaxID=1852828 RepID=A0A1V5M8C0_UNCT6|nr:MAG: Acyl carrier protein [candidate division TA06 bacterium ADurb.Bin417]HNQ35863.1 acyl carrier protein [bacterium]HNS48844.1 acyl carrier protein [bacterium]
MKQTEVETRVKQVVARLLKVPEAEIKSESDFVKDLGAESIQSLELVASFESEFEIEMDEDAALAVKTVGSAVEFISRILQTEGRLD